MMTSDPRPRVEATQLDDIVAEHRELRREVDELMVMAEHGVELDRALADRMAQRLTRLCDRLCHHFAFEEKGGYLREVVALRPGLQARVSNLRDEHEQFLALGAALTRELLSEPPPRDAGKRIVQFLESLRRHELAEHDLIQQAFNDDVGSAD